MASVKDIFNQINKGLQEDSSRAGGVEAVYQFNLTGDEEGTFQVVLKGADGYAAEGEKEDADCTLTLDSNDFAKMAEGELNGTEAFMSGQLQIDGDMGLALRLQEVLEAYNAEQQ